MPKSSASSYPSTLQQLPTERPSSMPQCILRRDSTLGRSLFSACVACCKKHNFYQMLLHESFVGVWHSEELAASGLELFLTSFVTSIHAQAHCAYAGQNVQTVTGTSIPPSATALKLLSVAPALRSVAHVRLFYITGGQVQRAPQFVPCCQHECSPHRDALCLRYLEP